MDIYENHFFDDPELPIIFHHTILTQRTFDTANRHENIELLIIKHGHGIIRIDSNYIPSDAGDIIVVNSNKIHSLSATEGYDFEYYCLIIDKNFCNRFGFDTSDCIIREKIDNPQIYASISHIDKELKEKSPFFRAAVMQEILNILVILFRNYLEPEKFENSHGKNTKMIKEAITYMSKHCTENISVSDISDYVVYSMYHFCRSFKQITGYTVNNYLNSLKIQKANTYLKQGAASVAEVAAKCGFDNISYFTKIFKKYTTHLSSEVLKQKSE